MEEHEKKAVNPKPDHLYGQKGLYSAPNSHTWFAVCESSGDKEIVFVTAENFTDLQEGVSNPDCIHRVLAIIEGKRHDFFEKRAVSI